jgi:hypothetical protein
LEVFWVPPSGESNFRHGAAAKPGDGSDKIIGSLTANFVDKSNKHVYQ